MNHLENSFTRKTQLRIPIKFKDIEMDVAKAKLMQDVDPTNAGASFIEKLKTPTFTNIEKV